MIKACAWCKTDMGEVEPYENQATTHGLCPACEAVELTKLDATRPGPLRHFYDIQDEIGTWQIATFGAAPARACIMATRKKLSEEVHELELSLTKDDYVGTQGVRDELADVAIVLLGLAARLGVDLEYEIARKMKINRARRWSQAEAGQVSRHIVPAVILGSDPT